MTFEQFQASAVAVPNLGLAIGDELLDLIAGRVYAGVLYIEDVTTRSTAERAKLPKNFGRWYTCIVNREYHSDNLADVERPLYAFALSEQLIPDPNAAKNLAAALRQAEQAHTGQVSWDHFDARKLSETMVRLVDRATSKIGISKACNPSVTDWLNETDRAFIEAIRARLAADDAPPLVAADSKAI